MKKLILVIGCVLALSGCEKAKEMRVQLGEKMGVLKPQPKEPMMVEGSAYYNFPEVTPGKHYKSESSFCYKVQTDILCYDRPRQGWEDRMVGYQEPKRPVIKQPNYANAAPMAVQPMNAVVAPVGAVQQAQLPPLPRSTLTIP